MPHDADFRRKQREAFEAVLKALSVVKLDWTKRKLLAELRKELNISQTTYVELLERVLNDPEVKSSRWDVRFHPDATAFPRGAVDGGSLREALHEAGGPARERPRAYDTENDTDTERDEDYRKEEDFDDEDSFSEGSTSRPGGNRREGRVKGRKRKPVQQKKRPKPRQAAQDSSSSRTVLHTLSRDEVYQYEVRSAPSVARSSRRTQVGHPQPLTGTGKFDIAGTKPPYDPDLFEACLMNGSLDELKEMSKQVKRRRLSLINSMLDDGDASNFAEDDLVQKILLREKNARQVKALEHELSVLDKHP